MKSGTLEVSVLHLGKSRAQVGWQWSLNSGKEWSVKSGHWALASVAQLVGASSSNQRAVVWIPSQCPCLGYSLHPQPRCIWSPVPVYREATNWCFSLPSMFLSLSFPLSLKSMKRCPHIRIGKKSDSRHRPNVPYIVRPRIPLEAITYSQVYPGNFISSLKGIKQRHQVPSDGYGEASW